MTNRPLPLTPMEEFWFWEDRPAYPYNCFGRLRFDGILNRAAFESAAAVVLKRHPMLYSKVERTGGSRLQWVPVEHPQPAIKWKRGRTGGSFPLAARLDLSKETGLRIHIIEDDGATDMIAQFHHACMDGMGAFSWLNDLLIAYTQALGGATPPLLLPPLDPHKLRGRGKFGLTPARVLRMLPNQRVGLKGVKEFLLRPPAPLIPHEAAPHHAPPPKGYPAVISHHFDEEFSNGFRKAAIRARATTNDLLLRDLFLALYHWQVAQGHHKPDSWLRLTVPVDMRQPGDQSMSAANCVSMVFPARRGKVFEDPQRLLRGIQGELDLIKRLNLFFTFIFSLHVYRWLPGGLRKRSRAHGCMVSCAFTNLGKPLDSSPLPRQEGCIIAGNVTLKGLEVGIPFRPYTCASFAVHWYANRLSICLHYDPRVLSKDQATGLQNWYVKRIEESSRTRPNRSRRS